MFAVFKDRSVSPSPWVMIAIMMLALLAGMAMPVYTDLMGVQASKLLVLPALLVLGILFVYDRKMMLVLILLLRAAGDVVLETTRFSLGGYQTGVGGLINAFVILLALVLTAEHYKTLPRKAIFLWLPFLGICLFGTVIAPVPGDAVKALLTQISYFAMFVSASHLIRKPEDFRYCVKLVLWSSALPILYAFYQIGMGLSIGLNNFYFRLQSTFSHPNIFAFYLTLLLYLGFYVFKTMSANVKSRYRLFMVLYLFALIIMLLLTKTRSAWLSALFGFVVYALFFERRYLLFLFVLPVVALLIPGITDRFTDLGRGNEVVLYAKLNSFAWRVYLWESALNWMDPRQYVLGEGLASFRHFSGVFFPLAGVEDGEMGPGAHSVFVQWIFEIGVVGLGAYLYIFYKASKQLWQLWRVEKLVALILLVSIINYLIVNFSDNLADYLSFNWYFWFAIGAGVALANLLRNKPSPAI